MVIVLKLLIVALAVIFILILTSGIGYLLFRLNIGCDHDWECVAGYELGPVGREPWYRCKKCGKEEGLK